MPSLTRNPDDELIRRLVSLESRVQGLETQRSRPFIGGQAVASSPQTHASSGTTLVDLASSAYDSGGVVDTANDRLVAPVAGVYLLVISNPELTSDGPWVELGYWVNGTATETGRGAFVPGVGSMLLWPQTYVVSLNEGDYVDCRVFSSTGATLVRTQTAFRVTLDRLHD